MAEIHPVGETDRSEDRGAALPLPARDSRTTRFVGLGLLAGVTVGAIGLVVLNISHRASAPSSLGGSGGSQSHTVHRASVAGTGYVARRMPSAGRLPVRASATYERAIRGSGESIAGHVSPAVRAQSGRLSYPRLSKSPGATGTAEVGQPPSFSTARRFWKPGAESLLRREEATPVSSLPDDEFDFER
jgi:hypothetical protein